ncbi:Fic family protein [Leptotrichia buccalis]
MTAPIFFTLSDIHYLILADKKEDRGIYRRVPVRIMGAAHEPVQPYLIIPKMEELLEQYKNSKKDIVTKLARFHIEFEGIHPFIDGNWKDWKIINKFRTYEGGNPPIDIKFTDRLRYYEAFDEYHVKHNISAMSDMFARYLNRRLDLYLSILDK